MILVITALDCCVYCDSDNFNCNCEHDRTRTSFAKRPTPHTTILPHTLLSWYYVGRMRTLSSKNCIPCQYSSLHRKVITVHTIATSSVDVIIDDGTGSVFLFAPNY